MFENLLIPSVGLCTKQRFAKVRRGLCSGAVVTNAMLPFNQSSVTPPLPRSGTAAGNAAGDLLHVLVRGTISATPVGSMRMMSAGLMVEVLVEQGLALHQAKRLFSQIRKGAPLHEEWHEAFACGRFHQRQGRATLTTPLTGQHAYMFAQHRLNADVVRGEPGYPAPKSSPNDNADPDLKSASHGLAQISSKPHKRYRDDDEGDDEDSNEDSKSDPAFALLMLGAASSEAALLMLGAASSEAALPVPAKNSKRRREGQGAGSKRGSSHASLSVTQAELQAQIQRQLQQQQIHLQAHMQQELQRVQEHMQIEFQQHIQRITGLTSGQGFPGAGGGLSPFLPLYGQAMVQATSPGTVSNFHNPTSSVAPFTSVNEQSISDTGHSGLDFISRSANRDTQSLSSAELHRVKSSAVATAAAAAAMAGATDMTQPAALATLLTGKLMSADGDNSSSNLSLPLVQALAGEAPPDWTATLALAALAKQNTATELHLGPLASNPPESP